MNAKAEYEALLTIAARFATSFPIVAERPNGEIIEIGTRAGWLGNAPAENWVVESRVSPGVEAWVLTMPLAAAVLIERQGWKVSVYRTDSPTAEYDAMGVGAN